MKNNAPDQISPEVLETMGREYLMELVGTLIWMKKEGYYGVITSSTTVVL